MSADRLTFLPRTLGPNFNLREGLLLVDVGYRLRWPALLVMAWRLSNPASDRRRATLAWSTCTNDSQLGTLVHGPTGVQLCKME